MNLMTEKIKKWEVICCLNGMKQEVENRPETYEVHSWVFMIQNGTGHCVVRADSLDTIWKLWHPWRKLMDISIQPCLDLEETISLIKKTRL